jgi:hypothetical protein
MWTTEWLAGRRLDARLALTAKGRAALEALRAMERQTTVQEISLALMEQFPTEFTHLQCSVSFVSGLQSVYGK